MPVPPQHGFNATVVVGAVLSLKSSLFLTWLHHVGLPLNKSPVAQQLELWIFIFILLCIES